MRTENSVAEVLQFAHDLVFFFLLLHFDRSGYPALGYFDLLR